MSYPPKRFAALLLAVSGVLVFSACSAKKEALKPGTPAFYWSAAKETFAAGDYAKTTEHLDNLLASDNEYAARALPWSLVLTAGTAAGYMDLADAYEQGARANRTDPSSFRRMVSQYRTVAGRLSMKVAQKWSDLDKKAGDTIPLAFPFPKGSAVEVAQLGKIAKGLVVPQAEADSVQQQAIERGVLLTACDVVGAPNDAAKAQQAFSAAEVKAPRTAFQMAMANALAKEALLFTRDKLDEPLKLQALAERAQAALKNVPASKETKALDAKIQGALKKGKKG